MLSNPTTAIIWSMIKERQIGFFFLLASIPLVLLIKAMIAFYLPESFPLASNKLYSMALVAISPLLIMFFTFAEFNGKFTKSAFPQYLFVHPLSSFHLALIPILVGILLTFVYYVTYISTIFAYKLQVYQLALLLVYVTAAASWLQVMSWRYSNAPYISISIMISVAAIIFVLVVSSWGTEKFTPIIPKAYAYIGLFFLATSGVWLAINAVARARTHENTSKKRYLSNVGFFGFRLPQHYTSISQALFRYEWRVFGWILPMAAIPLVLLLTFIASREGNNQKLLDVISVMSITLIYLPWFLPAEMSKSGLSGGSTRKQGLSAYVCSLPISNFELAMAKLKLCFRSIGLFHFILLSAFSMVLIIKGNEIIMNPWILINDRFDAVSATFISIALLFWFPIIAWILGGNTLAWCLKGKHFFVARRLIIILIGLSLIIPFGFMVYSNQWLRSVLVEMLPAINFALFALLLTFFVISFKKFILIETWKRLTWVGVTGFGLLCLQLYSLSAFNLISLDNPHILFILLDLLILGVLPFLTSPFSIAENRAR